MCFIAIASREDGAIVDVESKRARADQLQAAFAGEYLRGGQASTLTRWPKRSTSVPMPSPLTESSTQIRSGVMTSGTPSRSPTENSFWKCSV